MFETDTNNAAGIRAGKRRLLPDYGSDKYAEMNFLNSMNDLRRMYSLMPNAGGGCTTWQDEASKELRTRCGILYCSGPPT